MPAVSVIIPVYNTEKYLSKCLDSLTGQTLSDIEIICINDCSPDNSLEILERYAAQDNRIKIINLKANGGAGHARNIGIDTATGEYIGFVDSDDFVDLDFYEKLYTKAKETNADVVKGNIVTITNGKKDYSFDVLHDEIEKSKVKFNGLFVSAIYNLDFIKTNKINFIENCTYGEDRLFPLKAAVMSTKFSTVRNTYYNYFLHNESSSSYQNLTDRKISDFILSTKQLVSFSKNSLSKDDLLNTLNSFIQQTIAIIESNSSSDKMYVFLSELFKEKFLISHDDNKINLNLFDCIEKKDIVGIKSLNIQLSRLEMIDKLRKNIKTRNSIPRRIFYIWFGGKKTPLANVCIENWREHLPDYEIVEVNENSPYFDFHQAYNSCKWFQTVYDKKMWAYVADYVRAKVLYDYGGVYLDTDMTIYKNLTPLLENKVFFGFEQPDIISAGIIGTQKGHNLFKDLLDFYHDEIFKSPLYVITHIITHLLKNNSYDGIKIYPKEYFYPFYGNEIFTPECITENTYAVHWWNSSWRQEEQEFFLQNKHKIALEEMDSAFQRYLRVKQLLKNAGKI